MDPTPWIVVGFLILVVACVTLCVLAWHRRMRQARTYVGGGGTGASGKEFKAAACKDEEMPGCGSPQGPLASEAFNGVPARAAGSCPRGHSLQRFVVPWTGDFSCEACGQEVSEGSALFSCRVCGYDMCASCSGMRSLLPVGPSPDGVDRVTCPGGHELRRLTTDPPGYRWPAVCSSCKRPNLAKSCSYFLHCSICRHDICPACAQVFMQTLADERSGAATSRGAPHNEALTSLGPVKLRFLSEDGAASTHEHSQAAVDEAARIVDSISTEIATVMAMAQAAPAQEKPALLERAQSLQTCGEYVAALRVLENKRSSVGLDPLGGVLLA